MTRQSQEHKRLSVTPSNKVLLCQFKGPCKFAAALFFSYFLAIPLIRAQQPNDPNLIELSQSQDWLKLLRYERSNFGLNSPQSAIENNDFFFSKGGRTDSFQELKSTIEAMDKPASEFEDINRHPQCRFPARYKWLRKNHHLSSQENLLNKCSDYQRWNYQGQVTSISLFFATGYFGNPASFFGHPLMKFNAGNETSSLNDTALNYGATTPAGENPVVYVLKGLLGGYSASFSHHDFYFHSHNYAETEMRDLWEYQLNLNPNEIEYVVDRTWELLGQNHAYYFLSDNCAYRMAEILEDVFGKSLIFRNGLYVIPIDVFEQLAVGTKANGEPMVHEVKLLPSRFSRLVEKYNSLNSAEQSVLKEIIQDPSKIRQDKFQALSEKEKARIADTLVYYYSFRKLKSPEDLQFEVLRTDIIRAQFLINEKPIYETTNSIRLAKPPHQSQKSFSLRLSEVFSEEVSNFQEITIRPALYDELSPAVGRPKNTSLIVFDTRLRYQENELSLRDLDFFRVSTLNTPSTDLPEDSGWAWKIQLGVNSQDPLCQNCLVASFSGGAGISRELFGNVDFYGLLKAGVQSNKNDKGTLHTGPEIGAFFEPLEWWKVFVSFEQIAFQNGLKEKDDIWKFEQRFGNSQSWDLRLEYLSYKDTQVRLNLGWYL